ncbi:MAG: hypothetical protein IJV45_00220 [Prevotella sp.]|nr:hypothetical protein [Prevotella sp.]
MKAKAPVVILLILLLTACFNGQRREMLALLGENGHPLLAAADSAIVAADYQTADSLLALFDTQVTTASHAAAMDRQLLALTRRYVDDELSDEDFSMADSLCRYYNSYREMTRFHSLSQLCLGRIYISTNDYPNALACFKHALNLATQKRDSLLIGWANLDLGDTYFEQRMLNDSKTYYHNCYEVAQLRHDTLRMAHASHRMAFVCSIENKIDSVIFYYQQAISLAEHLSQKDNIVPFSRANLCDILIQIEKFDEAARIMPHDSMNMANWAYWHLGQNHIDSACWYFERILPLVDVRSKVEYLRILSQIETSKGNLLLSNKYYVLLVLAMDSLNSLSQTEETRRVNAQYNVNAIKKERDDLAKKQKQATIISILLAIILIGSIPVALIFLSRYQQRKGLEIIQERILREEMERNLHRSQQELKNLHNQEALKLEQFRTTRIYKLLNHQMPDSPYRLSYDEWAELASSIDEICPHFTSRLLSLGKFSPDELRLCYLMKLNIPIGDMAELLNKTVSAISHARARMWKKISGRAGSTDEMDNFIRTF